MSTLTKRKNPEQDKKGSNKKLRTNGTVSNKKDAIDVQNEMAEQKFFDLYKLLFEEGNTEKLSEFYNNNKDEAEIKDQDFDTLINDDDVNAFIILFNFGFSDRKGKKIHKKTFFKHIVNHIWDSKNALKIYLLTKPYLIRKLVFNNMHSADTIALNLNENEWNNAIIHCRNTKNVILLRTLANIWGIKQISDIISLTALNSEADFDEDYDYSLTDSSDDPRLIEEYRNMIKKGVDLEPYSLNDIKKLI